MNLADISQKLDAESSQEVIRIKNLQFRQDIQQCFIDAGAPSPVAERMAQLAWERATYDYRDVLAKAGDLMEIVEIWTEIEEAELSDDSTRIRVNPKTLLFENLTPSTVRLLKEFSDEIFKSRKPNYQHPIIEMWYKECPVGEERLAIMLDVLHPKILASIVEYFMAGSTL